MDGPLKGYRVVEFGSAVAGPMASQVLGLLGAEVIKVESRLSPDQCRFFDILYQINTDGESSTMYNLANLNKKSITINLKQPIGVEVARQLMGKAHVVLENMRPGVMPRLGLGYEQIKKMNPNVIYVSSSACGQSGPEGLYSGYAPNFAALAGLASITGYEDGAPSTFGASVDVKSAMTCTFAILAALVHYQATGEGQFVDVSSSASISSLMGDVLLDCGMTGKAKNRKGNKHDVYVPHGCYRCRGYDKWISICVTNDEEWKALCEAMGKPELARDERFENRQLRQENQEELDRILVKWTQNRDPYEIMHRLQGAGVAAAPTLSSEGLYRDPHVRQLGVFMQIEHHARGRTWVIKPPWTFSETPARIERGAPKLGEHTDVICKEILGMPTEEIDELKEEKVLF
jgi:crotonobetainyl-CoA:carnitine CoA-transferase CaiB-like acyl-CoA transferase